MYSTATRQDARNQAIPNYQKVMSNSSVQPSTMQATERRDVIQKLQPLRTLSGNNTTMSAMPLSQQESSASPRLKQNYVETPLSPDDHENLSRHINKFLDIYGKLEPVNHPDVKPNYSYTELLMMAILRSPNYCRPIQEVYSYIREKYLFYKHTKKGFWKNAIRHSLSKTKCFTKLGVSRSMKTAGVLNRPVYLWTLVPECLVKFAEGGYRVNLDSNGANNLKCAFTQVNAEAFWTNVAKTLALVLSAIKTSLTPETTTTFAKEQQAPKRDPEVRSCNNEQRTGSPDHTSQPMKRVKLEPNSYTPNGDISNVRVPKFAYSPVAPFQQFEARPFSHLYGNTDNSYSCGYDFSSMIPDIAQNFTMGRHYDQNTPAVHPAYVQTSPYAYTTLRNREEENNRKCNVTSPNQHSTSPNSSIDVTGLGNSSFSDSFRSVDNEDRKTYVEVETTDFGGEYSFEPVASKFETQRVGNELMELLVQGGLTGMYQF
ncbi:uncharacterized protein LOC135503406 [Lineus longissimus]|uniref:uncharacterized protein LOC135503406 n=1 Tax=Lineus longissimus TaxID=88925 RepID=UPI00315C5E77